MFFLKHLNGRDMSMSAGRDDTDGEKELEMSGDGIQSNGPKQDRWVRSA